jgi:hypothetical protein
MPRHWLGSFGLCGALAGACSPAPPQRLIESHAASVKISEVPASLVSAALSPVACFGGMVCLADIRLPSEPVEAGKHVKITYFWSVRREPGAAWKVFVHGSTGPSVGHRFSDDRDPGGGSYPIARWRVGDLIQETRKFKLPNNLPSDRYELWGGFFQDGERMMVSRGLDDGKRRARFGSLHVKGLEVPVPKSRVARLSQPLIIDGKLNDVDWAKAQRLGPFWRHDGSGKGRFATFARLLWDDAALYLAFEAEDPDVHTPYSKRDDPIYESEAVEIFIDADADGDDYIELQVAPNNVQFDARFAGGARQNMDKAWNHPYETAVSVDGSLNDGRDKDRGWTAEWRIPFAGIPDLAVAPKAGDSWKVNLFRLDRLRRGAKIVGTGATAWSAPLSGDFHRLERFGSITFSP